MNNFLTRTITGLSMVLLIVAAVIFSSISYFVLFLLIIVVGLWEFYGMSHMLRVRPQTYVGILIGVLIFTVNFFYAIDFIHVRFFLVFIPLLLIIFIYELYRDNKRPFSNIAFTYLGIIYVAIPVSLWNFLILHTGEAAAPEVLTEALFDPINYVLQPSIHINYTPGILLGFLMLTWANDTGAYLAGMLFGRRKLFMRISPKKTWEGFAGGMILTFLAAFLVSILFADLSLVNWMVIGIIATVMGTFGDLVESMYKRSLGAKDSGKILPGHGGMLDRFDALLLSSPVVFTYLELINT